VLSIFLVMFVFCGRLLVQSEPPWPWFILFFHVVIDSVLSRYRANSWWWV